MKFGNWPQRENRKMTGLPLGTGHGLDSSLCLWVPWPSGVGTWGDFPPVYGQSLAVTLV